MVQTSIFKAFKLKKNSDNVSGILINLSRGITKWFYLKNNIKFINNLSK